MTTTLKRIGISFLILLILAGLGYWFGKDAFLQSMTKDFFKDIENKALAEPFRGVESRAGKIEGLFPIRSTGVSTAPIKLAAENLLSTLNDEMRSEIQFEVDDVEWRKWSNVDNGIYERQGVSLKEMNVKQKSAAFKLMKESLSAKGLQLSKDIMKTDQTLRELNDDQDAFDEELYFITLMGAPSESKPWGWQLDGHHLIINYFILGDQVVMTPSFMGGEPIITTSGKYKGNTLFQDEQNIGLAFMQSLPPKLQKEATLSPDKNSNNNEGEMAKDNITLDYEGLRVSKLSDEHKSALLNLAFQYIGNMRKGHSKVKMEEIEAHWEDTWFAWVGKTDDEAVFYYRIHSPVVLIEFDHQHPVGAPSDKEGPSRNHIHTVVRTPNGNDYGKDLLRQHLENHQH
ncbi:MAG: DUF3500 domain-containing protein [Bacteroidota bacterium]